MFFMILVVCRYDGLEELLLLVFFLRFYLVFYFSYFILFFLLFGFGVYVFVDLNLLFFLLGCVYVEDDILVIIEWIF